MKTDQPLSHIYRNPWVIATFIFFIVFKFFLIGLLWHDRAVPPEPDDSYSYSGYIYSVIRCPQIICNTPYVSTERPDGWHFLTYRVVWGLTAKALGIDSVTMYHATFYIGTIMLALVLLYALSKLTAKPKLIAFSLAILALFYGGGSWHGFFWVAPSFFAVLLFFWLFALIHRGGKPRWQWLGMAAVAAALLFIHPLGIYFTAVLFMYIIIRSLMPQRPIRLFLAPALVIMLTVAVLYVPVQLYLTDTPLPYTAQPQAVISEIDKSPAWQAYMTKQQMPVATPGLFTPYIVQATYGWQRFSDDYLDWIFPSLLGVVPYVIFIVLIWRARNFRLLALYLSTLIFSLASVIHPYGGRAIIILWPVTFILYAFGFWYVFSYITKRAMGFWRKVGFHTVAGLTLLLFTAANIVHSILFAEHLNQRGDIAFSDDFVPFVLASTPHNEPTRFLDKTLWNYATNTEMVSRPISDPTGKSKLILELRPHRRTLEGPTPLEIFLGSATTLFTGNTPPITPTTTLLEPSPVPKEEHHAWPSQEFDHVTVYTNPNF